MRAAAVARCGLVLAVLLAAPLTATAAQPITTGSIAPPAADQSDDGAPLTAEDSAALGQVLVFDPASLAAAPATPLSLPSLSAPPGPAISGQDKPDGSGTIAIKQALPTDWNAKVGVDLTLAAPPPVSYQPGAPLPGSASGASSGAAWASLGVFNVASIDARIDPTDDQGRLGTTLQHAIPLGDNLSLTLRDSYAVTDSLGTSDGTPAAPAGLPVMALPQASAGPAPQPVWSNERGVKFNILPTGTTLAANLATASNDPVTHNTLSADQKLFGPLHVTTAVIDLGEPTVNKSITAGFTLNW